MPSKKGKKRLIRKKRVKKQKNKSFLKSFFKLTFIMSIIVILSLIGIAAGTFIGIVQTSDIITPEDFALEGFTTTVYDSNGELVTPIHGTINRLYVDINTIPDNLKNAFIAIEDKRFYEHQGIDLRRTISAGIGFFQDSDSTHGGSTITQQVVRNLTHDFDRTIQRKLQEQWRAIELERHLTKSQILEVYMNIIFMGNNCYGVGSAAKVYFDKNVEDLTLAQSAILAGITNAPTRYNPFTENGRKSIKNRQEIILREMLSLGFITQKEYENALKEDLNYTNSPTHFNTSTTIQSYFIDQVIKDVQRDLIEKGYSRAEASHMIYNNGLKIYTTKDPKVQNAMDIVFSNPENFPIVQGELSPQSAMVILDPQTAQVRAIYGGAGPKTISMGYNHATDMTRQLGSTIKPIAIYGPAMDTGRLTAGTVLNDIPVYLDHQKPDERYPTNYNQNQYHGLILVREALRMSLNTVAAKAWIMDSNFPNVGAEYMYKKGIDLRDEASRVATALGGTAKGTSPLELAAAYVPFANGGAYFEPTTYTKVLDSTGRIILEKDLTPNFVYDDTTAYLMTYLLKDAVRFGTGYPQGLLQNGNMPSAGKTGTTSKNKDKWFVGYSPYYVGATWFGYSDNTSLIRSEFDKAKILWSQVMEKIHQNLEPKDFEKPSRIVTIEICKYSGKRPGPNCNNDPRGDAIITEKYALGTEPSASDICDVHVTALVCKDHTGELNRPMLLPPNLSSDLGEERVFINRPTPYIPTKDNEPKPLDFIYEIPTEYCRFYDNDIDFDENDFEDAIDSDETDFDEQVHQREDSQSYQLEETNLEDTSSQ